MAMTNISGLAKFKIEQITTDEGLSELAQMADEIWHEFFPGVISEEQIDYMVEKFQSYEAMKAQIAEQGYRYFGVWAGGELCGYFAVCKKRCMKLDKGDSLFLSKLYLKKSMRGKGFARLMFKEVRHIARAEGCELIWLTVNKHNDHAVSVYKHMGMTMIREEVTDIGGGFVMDDYVFGIMV